MKRLVFAVLISFCALSLFSSTPVAESCDYDVVKIGKNKIGLQSLWLYSPALNNEIDFDRYSNVVFTSISANATDVFLVMSNPEIGEHLLYKYDAKTGTRMSVVKLSGLPNVTVPVSDIFTDSEGNICGCSKAFDGIKADDDKLVIYKISETGDVSDIHKLTVTAKNDIISSCRINGSIESDNFETFAVGLVDADVRVLEWKTPLIKPTYYALNIQSNSEYNVIERVDDNIFAVSTSGNRLVLSELKDGKVISVNEVSQSVKQNCVPSAVIVSDNKMLVYTTVCNKSQGVRFGVSLLNDDNLLWLFPEKGLGYKSVCQSSQAKVSTYKFSEYETRVYVYSVGIGLGAYSIYDMEKGGLESADAEDYYTIEDNTIKFKTPLKVNVYDSSGKIVISEISTTQVHLTRFDVGVYFVITPKCVVKFVKK